MPAHFLGRVSLWLSSTSNILMSFDATDGLTALFRIILIDFTCSLCFEAWMKCCVVCAGLSEMCSSSIVWENNWKTDVINYQRNISHCFLNSDRPHQKVWYANGTSFGENWEFLAQNCVKYIVVPMLNLVSFRKTQGQTNKISYTYFVDTQRY